MPPARRSLPPSLLARKAAMARFESTALARVPSWGSSARVKRPIEIRKAQDTQVRAMLATLPPEKRREFLSAYRQEVRDRIRSLELAETVFSQHQKDLAAAKTREHYKEAYIRMHQAMREVVGATEARFILTSLEQKGKLTPASLFGEHGVVKSLAEAARLVDSNMGVVMNMLNERIPNIQRRREMFESIYPDICERMLDLPAGESVDRFLGLVTRRSLAEKLRQESGVRTRTKGGGGEVTSKKRNFSHRILSLERMIENSPSGERNPRSVRERIEPADHRPAQSINQEWGLALSKAFEGLDSQQQKVLYLHYFEGVSLKETGKTIRVSESRAGKIEKAALALLRLRLAKYFR